MVEQTTTILHRVLRLFSGLEFGENIEFVDVSQPCVFMKLVFDGCETKEDFISIFLIKD